LFFGVVFLEDFLDVGLENLLVELVVIHSIHNAILLIMDENWGY
jgi:hypothetical protein